MEDKIITKDTLIDKSEQSSRFLKFANEHYEDYKKKWAKYLYDRQVYFDEDVFSETVLKVYDYINTNGIKDDSDSGLANYWFKAFNINIKREKQYSRNLKIKRLLPIYYK